MCPSHGNRNFRFLDPILRDDDDDDDNWWQITTLRDFFVDETVFVAFGSEKFSSEQLTLSDEGLLRQSVAVSSCLPPSLPPFVRSVVFQGTHYVSFDEEVQAYRMTLCTRNVRLVNFSLKFGLLHIAAIGWIS